MIPFEHSGRGKQTLSKGDIQLIINTAVLGHNYDILYKKLQKKDKLKNYKKCTS